MLEGKRVLVTGGTGSFGKVVVRRLLSGELGIPERITVFSRDEAKQYDMQIEYQRYHAINGGRRLLDFRIGDVRDYHSISGAVAQADIVFNAAALKQVPTCEYFPFEAVSTNIVGAENIVRAIREMRLPVGVVVGLSTDKACKPVNVMGMTKAIQERIFISGNIDAPQTRFICVRYGNVLASRGSVIPLFHRQIRQGGPVTVTVEYMTRFLLSLDSAVNTIFAALKHALPGEIFIPKVKSARMKDLAEVLIGSQKIKIINLGIRPGEKIHEVMISEDEIYRTVDRGEYYAIIPNQKELQQEEPNYRFLENEYSSADHIMNKIDLRNLLEQHGLLVEVGASNSEEWLV
jgi:FlaA1/EpsC-like NDP-sugar epimerase